MIAAFVCVGIGLVILTVRRPLSLIAWPLRWLAAYLEGTQDALDAMLPGLFRMLGSMAALARQRAEARMEAWYVTGK